MKVCRYRRHGSGSGVCGRGFTVRGSRSFGLRCERCGRAVLLPFSEITLWYVFSKPYTFPLRLDRPLSRSDRALACSHRLFLVVLCMLVRDGNGMKSRYEVWFVLFGGGSQRP
jgi:hypothetical protein